MTRAMYQNKRMALLPSIDDPKGSPFLSPTPKPKVTFPNDTVASISNFTIDVERMHDK